MEKRVKKMLPNNKFWIDRFSLSHKKSAFKHKGEKTGSIKRKLITICILFAIIPLLVVNIISSSISKKALRETSEQFASELVRQISVNINAFVSEVEKNVTQFTIGELVQKNLITAYNSGNTLEKVTATRTIEQSIRYLKTMDKNITSTAIMLSDDRIIGAIEQMSVEDFIEAKATPSVNGSIWFKGLGDAKEDIFFIKNMDNLSESDRCTVLVTVNTEAFIQNIKNVKLLEGSNLYIADQAGSMIYNQNASMRSVNEQIWTEIGKEKQLGEQKQSGTLSTPEMLVTYAILPNGWHVIAEIPVRSLTSKLDAATIGTWLLILLVSVLAILIGTLVARSFSNPIIKLMTLMKKAEEGDLTVQITEKGNDEIARLCHSFNHMIANIRVILNDTKVVIAETLDGSQVLQCFTSQSAETMGQLSMSINEITAGTVQQAEDAQESSEVMIALSDSMQDVMQKTNAIFKNNQGAKEMISTATNSMNHLSSTMASSFSASNQIQNSILELSALNKNIEDIMKLVDSISEHTNLLALNASIEAARAGEVGKGFAVVAGEVRNLADQSKESTMRVRKTLDIIENKTKDTVNLVEQSNAIFKSQEEALKKVHETFFSIIDTLKNMDIDLEQVNDKIQNMRLLKEEMVSKVDNIATVTQESAASTQEISALTEEQKGVIENLSELAQKLAEAMTELSTSVQAFKVE